MKKHYVYINSTDCFQYSNAYRAEVKYNDLLLKGKNVVLVIQENDCYIVRTKNNQTRCDDFYDASRLIGNIL